MKYIRGNNMPFLNKELSKAHKKRTYLRNRFLKKRSDQNKKLYTKQRNYCVSLLRKTKKNHYVNLNQKDIADNKQFWRTVKPLLSDKSKSNEKITLVEGGKITGEDNSNAEILNSFFCNAVKNLKIPEFKDTNPLTENIPHPAFKAILKYKNHPSIIAIKNARRNGLGFYFSEVSVDDICKELKKLNPRKAAQNTDIPIKILKENADIFSSCIYDFFKETIRSGKFPSILKKANIAPVFKKGFKRSKENYRPVSILPVISKIFEKMISKPITSFMDPLLSKYRCGFQRGFSAQNCLLAMLEKWKSSVDKGKVFSVLLTDLSKAFDCLSHELIIAKLNAFGFSLSALKLMKIILLKENKELKSIKHIVPGRKYFSVYPKVLYLVQFYLTFF